MRRFLSLILIALALGLTAGFAAPAGAVDLAPPSGDVILTVSGKITHTNGDGVARFDRAMLKALAQREATLETPWTKGKVTFSGPLGRALLTAVGAEGTIMKVTALNDYAVDLPVADFLEHDTILATHLDGKLIEVREKGPLFLIYPFDKEPDLYNEKYFSRSVWQIASITLQ